MEVQVQDCRLLQLKLQINSHDKQIERQRRRIEILEQYAAEAAAAKGREQQRILLGQAAYALSKVVEDHVYSSVGYPGSLGLPVSLKQMHKSVADLTTEQVHRWDAFQRHCWSIIDFEDLLVIDKALRNLAFHDAQGSQREMLQATLQDLKCWARVQLPPGAVTAAHKYLRILNKFSSKTPHWSLTYQHQQCLQQPMRKHG